MINFFTSFNKNYAPQALVLASSIRENCTGEYRLTALIVDELSKKDRLLLLEFFDEIVFAKSLNVHFSEIVDAHNVVEACTFFKPHCLGKLLEYGNDVVYLDPDVFVTADLTGYFRSVLPSDCSVHLTPHTIAPVAGLLPDASELSALKYGIFNLGFLRVKSTDTGVSFSKWWSDRIYLSCKTDSSSINFTDQKIIDLAVAVFPDVYIDRNPGLNVAPWNLHERYIDFDGESYFANRKLLYFFHFSKLNNVGALEFMVNSSDCFSSFHIAIKYSSLLAKYRAVCRSIGFDFTWAYGRDPFGVAFSEEQLKVNHHMFKKNTVQRLFSVPDI